MLMQRPEFSPYLPASLPAFVELPGGGFVPSLKLTPEALEAAEQWTLDAPYDAAERSEMARSVHETRRYLEARDPRFPRVD